MKISSVLSEIIAFMINWRYGLDLKASDVVFNLSSDFTPTPTGEGWLRLATEWYEGGLIPRSVWLQLLKQNDILSPGSLTRGVIRGCIYIVCHSQCLKVSNVF